VRICAVGNELVAELLELHLESLGVLDDLLLVLLEFGGSGLLESDGESGDGVVVGSTLVTWEDREVDRALEVVESLLAGLGICLANTLAEEDHGTTRTTEGLVGGRSDDVCMLEGTGDNTSSDETRNVCHVNDEIGANKVCNLAHAAIVDQTAVCGSSSHKDLWSVHQSILLQFVVVNNASIKVNSVWEGFEVGRYCRNPRLLLEDQSFKVPGFAYFR
jgi:hypothetical protein